MNLKIRQGGMGVDISTPRLAREVALNGGLGTVSGVMVDRIMARILQRGDINGNIRRALADFPFPKFAEMVLEKYFVDGGIPLDAPFKSIPIFTLNPSEELIALTVCANFAFVWLAKEEHEHPIAINYLEKVQLQHTYSFVGAMLAGVDTVTMGAGIPTQVPGTLDAIARGEDACYNISIEGIVDFPCQSVFNTEKFFGTSLAGLKRPDFIPIVTTDTLAQILVKRSTGKIQGFVIERPSAGGHNAPPRDKNFALDEKGEPVYSERDYANMEKMRALELPFWVGGGLASPEGLAYALENGAEGIQAGSIFALAKESGIRDDLKRELIRQIFRGEARSRTDLNASPTGFPFKLVDLYGTSASRSGWNERPRKCDQGLLLKPYANENGGIGYRCPAEEEEAFRKKGGDMEKTEGACCLCNSLASATAFGDKGAPATITLGDDLSFVRKLINNPHAIYGVKEVMNYLLG